MSRPIRAVLLDLDGTLVDSQPGILASCRVALRALGHPLDPVQDLSAVIGPPMEDVMWALLEPFGDDRVDEAVSAYCADYGETGLFGSIPYAGIANALEQLRRAGAILHLATSERTVFARRILEHLGLDGFFAGIHGSEPGGALDHKSELIAHVMARHAPRPAACVMVGDRRYDIAGAHANGVQALGVLWGYGTQGELEAVGADDLIADPLALPGIALEMIDKLYKRMALKALLNQGAIRP